MTGPQTAPTRPAPPAHQGLRRFRAPQPQAPERCELCAAVLAEHNHRHLVDTKKRALACACTPCALLFDRPGSGAGQFRTVPDRYLVDSAHTLDDAAWDLLQIPVGVAFFLRNADLDRLVALYPSPAGATESELDPATWQTVVGASRLAQLLEPDVEALLVRRTEGRIDCYLVPVDICYELVGRMRLLWQGFDGGPQARTALADFFTQVARRARPPKEDTRP
ncbi:DUF5947 family protein [Streptomyces sp. NPDC017993]|uniref:DUF5947 family protein n=1 Tax=Streptomyces sp. NPDC017993 TaxID=3365027 RepID=UPI0037BBFE43